MSGMENKTVKTVIISALGGLIVTVVSILVFAAVMYFAGLDKIYSVIFATVAVAIGCFTAAYIAAYKNKQKGFLTGVIVGGSVFTVILLISLLADKGAVTSNTLFHFIIFMLSSVIGGVMGVNKADSRKYIK